MEENGGKWGGNGEKWRKMGVNGGKWGNVRRCQKYRVGNVEKICEIRRKLEENRRKMRQFGTSFPFFPVPFSPFFHSLATFPSGASGPSGAGLADWKNGKFLTSRQRPIFRRAPRLGSGTRGVHCTDGGEWGHKDREGQGNTQRGRAPCPSLRGVSYAHASHPNPPCRCAEVHVVCLKLQWKCTVRRP